MPVLTDDMLAKPKRMAHANLTTAHRRAPAQEREVAARLGGTVTPGSGNGMVKGDVRVARVARIECKTTSGKSFSVTRDMVAKIEAAALGAGEVPAMVVEFLGCGAEPPATVAVVPLWVLDSICKPCKKRKG